jgi:hypothetical protein
MKVGELCRRLSIPYRHVRYVLEEGVLPKGVEESPERGNHRDLRPEQAFWLGMVLRLKQSGVKTPLAAQMADFARSAMQGIAQLNWEYTFSPFNGRLETCNQWWVEVGDLRYIRLATTACPTREGSIHNFGWFPLKGKRKRANVTPVVTIRVDLAELARLLRDTANQSATAKVAAEQIGP